MIAIIPEEINITRSFLFEDTVFNNPFRITRSFLFEGTVFNNPFRITRSFLFEGTVFINPFLLRRSQILVARRRCAMHFGFDSPRNNFAPTARNTPEPHRSNNIAHLRSAWKNVTVTICKLHWYNSAQAIYKFWF